MSAVNRWSKSLLLENFGLPDIHLWLKISRFLIILNRPRPSHPRVKRVTLTGNSGTHVGESCGWRSRTFLQASRKIRHS